ncbi:MAG: hypothetical protein KF745_06365 [Phycisphaeraceae bacterium]|nr:hypothetical protein [Phycisphaeraceae bacterium]
MTDPRFYPRPQKPTAKPRRVTNGVKLRSKEGPDQTAWASQRWMRLIEQVAPPPQLAEGLEYARLGQTRRLDAQPGSIVARVQGRMPNAYDVAIRLPTFSPEQWEQVITAMAEQARYAASLLSGELPSGIEDVFIPLGLKLFPVASSDCAVSCTCDVSRTSAAGEAGWCKHACCVMALIADRLAADPFLIFLLRGQNGEDMLERLRHRRAATQAKAGAAGAGLGGLTGDVPLYVPHIPGISDQAGTPLEQSIDHFWTIGPELASLELPIGPPEVSHPLLRRLGPSPFEAAAARFPLVGLLATCYDVISAAAIRAEEGEPPADADSLPGTEPPADPPPETAD